MLTACPVIAQEHQTTTGQCRTVSSMSVPVTPTQTGKVIAYYEISHDAGTCIHQQPSRLLQQPVVRRQSRAATEVTSHPECGSMCGDQSQVV